MRVKTEFWVKAYVRRCNGAGAAAFVVRRGQREAGAIFVKINRLDGTVSVLGPAPATMTGEDGERCWAPAHDGETISETDADRYVRRQAEFDPDIWVLEIEDRQGRDFLGDAVRRD